MSSILRKKPVVKLFQQSRCIGKEIFKKIVEMAYEMDFCVRIMYPLKNLLDKYQLLHDNSDKYISFTPVDASSGERIATKYRNKRLPSFELNSMSFPYFDYQRFYNLRCHISQEILIREDFLVIKYITRLSLQVPHKDHVEYDAFDDDEIHYEYQNNIPMICYTIDNDNTVDNKLKDKINRFYNAVFDFMKITHPNEMKIALEKQE